MSAVVMAPPAPARPAPRLSWAARLVASLSTYLPLLVMALLALGSWWLVQNTPLDDGAAADAPPRHEPDYTMRDFIVRRFANDGSLRAQIEGDVALHYPDTDTLEIKKPRIRATSEKGQRTFATADRALANGDGSQVQLFGAAHVGREATPRQAAVDFRGEFLEVFLKTERVRSHLPVTVTQAGSEVRAAGMDYDNLSRVVELKGRVKAVFAPPRR